MERDRREGVLETLMKLIGRIFLPFVVHFPGNVNGRYNFPAAVSEGLK
jgi:hypothetical protein